MNINRFTEKSQEALREAQGIATRRNHQGVDVEHLLLALLEDEQGLGNSVLKLAGVDTTILRTKVEAELAKIPRVSGTGADASQAYVTQRLGRVLARAEQEADKLKAEIAEMEEEIKTLGFRFEVFGKNSLLISGIPAGTTGSEKELFEGLIEQFKKNQAELALPLRENLARSLAKRAGIKAGQKLGKEEIEALLSGLFACHTPNFTPEGDTTFFIFDTSKIESYLKR